MDKNTEQLVELNKKLDIIINIMNKPENRWIRIIEIGGTIITIMSILSVIDIIKKWLGF